jgi:type II secretory pathway component HofQ
VVLCYATGDSLDKAKEVTRTLDFPDQDIRTALRQIADLYEINVVIPDDLNGRASISLRNVTWEQAFQVLLAPIGGTYRQQGDVIVVETKKTEASQNKETQSPELTSALMSSMAEIQLTAVKHMLQDKEFAQALAEFDWNLYSALQQKGFTKEQALQIVCSGSPSGFPSGK